MRKLFILALLALAGCASAEQRRAETAAKHDQYCKSIGASTGTPAYTDCRLKVMQMSVSESNANRQAAAIESTGPTFTPAPVAPISTPVFGPQPQMMRIGR
jgi:hypothetical protein